MRLSAGYSILALLVLPGCEGVVQDVYDDRAEEECLEMRNIDDQRACLNALEDRQRERRRQDRMDVGG